jgi:hypothetical protein
MGPEAKREDLRGLTTGEQRTRWDALLWSRRPVTARGHTERSCSVVPPRGLSPIQQTKLKLKLELELKPGLKTKPELGRCSLGLDSGRRMTDDR